jgi:hypothetical protein
MILKSADIEILNRSKMIGSEPCLKSFVSVPREYLAQVKIFNFLSAVRSPFGFLSNVSTGLLHRSLQHNWKK